MDSSNLKETLFDLFPEDLEELNNKKAEAIFAIIKPYIDENLEELSESIADELISIHEKLDSKDSSDADEKILALEKKFNTVETIKKTLGTLRDALDKNNTETRKQIDNLSVTSKEIGLRAIRLINELGDKFSPLESEIQRAHTRIDNVPEEYNDNDVWKELKDLRKLILSRQVGGGNMNRNIAIGGNQSVLGRYTDVNLKAGSNVTITYTNNNTTKYVDVTIAATGGSGSGIVRSVNNINTNTVAGSTSTTDYVYLCTGPLTLTLPDATGNTNLYTVKNVGGGTTTINTTSSQTIDGGLTATLSTLYIEITLVSDGSNWNVGV